MANYGARSFFAPITFEAVDAGAVGNDIVVTVLEGTVIPWEWGVLAKPAIVVTTSVAVVDRNITVQLGDCIVRPSVVYGWGTYQTHYAEQQSPTVVKAAIEASAEAVALITVKIPDAGSQDDQFVKPGEVTLSAGCNADEPYVTVDNADRSFTHLCARPASERLFGVDAADTTNVRWCHPFDATRWTPETGQGESVYSPGGRFIALADTGDTLVLFANSTMYRIDGTDPKTWVARKVQTNGLVCTHPNTIQVIESIPVYRTARGIAYFDGTKPKILSDNVFDSSRPEASIIPATTGGIAFATQDEQTYIIFFGTADDTFATQVATYDFRMQAWGGPWSIEALGAIGACAGALHDAKGARPTVFSATELMAQFDGYTDIGEPYEMRVSPKTVDGAIPSIDKIFVDLRVVVFCHAELELTYGIVREDSSSDVAADCKTVTLAAGAHVLRHRLKDVRASSAFPFVKSSCECDLEVVSMGVELFFCRA